jgi:hypothetical protein
MKRAPSPRPGAAAVWRCDILWAPLLEQKSRVKLESFYGAAD